MPSTPSHAFNPQRTTSTLFAEFLAAKRRHGAAKPILEDMERAPLTYKRAVLGALVLGGKLAALSERREVVGVLLPNANGLVLSLLGLNAFGRVAAMLNFTAGIKNLRSAVRTAQIRTIITSRRFVDTAKLEDVVAALEAQMTDKGAPVRVVYLEDVRKSIGLGDKVRGVLRSLTAARVHAKHALQPDEPAAILFTSGTEGDPKGVVLSNRNIVANAQQIAAIAMDFMTPDDVVINPLPMFHSFGLTAGTLFPVLSGMKTVLYPSPLHYKQVPALVKSAQATVMFATDTFLQGYGRAADQGELDSVRYVVCGAERVKETTRGQWSKYGAQILEGYGATECSPVISCNVPSSNMPGTVGALLPGIESRLEPVDGIHDGGQLFVRGPNVMLGYMRAAKPGVIEPPQDGWHDTGDIVVFDEARRITIKGRAKRFAKIGGEMISLAAVESMVGALWPDSSHVIISLPDPRKGEQLVLLTDRAKADKAALLAEAKREGFAELWVPRAILVVPQIPVLGSGKVDYPTAIELARQARPLL